MEGMSEAYRRTLSTVIKWEFWRMSIGAGRLGGVCNSRESVTCRKGSVSKDSLTIQVLGHSYLGRDTLGLMDPALSPLETLEACLRCQ